MDYCKAREPKSFEAVLGNKEVISQLQGMQPLGKSVILYGKSGIGKSCLARLYLEYVDYEVSGPLLSNDDIRSLHGHVLINELDCMNSAKQKLLIPLLDSGRLVFVGTTTAYKTKIVEEVRTRCINLNVTYPTLDECKEYIKFSTQILEPKLTDEEITLLYEGCKNLRGLNNAMQYLMYSQGDDTENRVKNAIHAIGHEDNSMEEIKSALQKSIRGSDVDAACIYAMNLLQNGYLEDLARRLLVIASEDIGLANSTAVLVTKACVDNALATGMPEAAFPIIHAVSFLALQPKSNSVHEIISKCKSLPKVLNVPDNIKYTHSYSYKYPFEYPNNWVKQPYMPIGLENVKVYKPQSNKNEKAFEKYWQGIKGE